MSIAPTHARFTAEQYLAAREGLVAAVKALFGNDVMAASGHGNISVRLPGTDLLAINAGELLRPTAAADLDVATPGARRVNDDVVVVDLDGTVLTGTPSPSVAAVLHMHTGVYRARPGVGAVLHTHSPAATGFALAARPIPAHYEALAVHGQAVDVPVAPWAPRGSDEAVKQIRRTFDAHPDSHAVLLGNHGLLVSGDDARHAARLVTAVEEAAVATLGAATLGGSVPFPPGADLRALRLNF